MNKLEKIMYTAHTHTTGGRDGKAVSDDGLLNVNLALPKAMGGLVQQLILSNSSRPGIQPVLWGH